jgi:hypothetical protein
MVQASQLEMPDRTDVAARITPEMVKEVWLGINPEEFARVDLIVIAAAWPNAFFGDQVCDVVPPAEFECFAAFGGLDGPGIF